MPRLPGMVLGLCGAAMVLAGAVGIVLGVTSGPFVRSLLPPVAVDAAAVGGALVALSAAVILIGALQLVLARAASRGGHWGTAMAVIVTGLLAAAFLAIAVVSATEAAVSSSPALLAAGLALLLLALAYAAASITLARSSV